MRSLSLRPRAGVRNDQRTECRSSWSLLVSNISAVADFQLIAVTTDAWFGMVFGFNTVPVSLRFAAVVVDLQFGRRR